MKYLVEIDNVTATIQEIEASCFEWDDYFLRLRNDEGRIVAMFAIRTVLSVIEAKT